MVIGERLKMARRMARLSQRDLADRAGVSAMSISKYERNLSTPGSEVLINLAKALDVRVEYLLRPVTVSLSSPAYRCLASLRKQDEKAILEETRDWLERYLDVESLFGALPAFEWPDIDRRVATLDEVEQVAVDVRHAWDMGLDPIDSLIECIETHGIKVGTVQGEDEFDALLLWANENVEGMPAIPVIVVKRDVPGDRQRFNLAHELGHLILEVEHGLDEEKAAYRFAGAFLVPAPVAYRELGQARQALDLHELYLLKQKYGLSMQAWIYRAKDLGIISEAEYDRMFRRFNRKGWRRKEPGEEVPPERPSRMERMVLRALAEDVISRSRAAELMGKSLGKLFQRDEDA
jgi:Zn-dependent peptidase ImmA (M78 family)/DNA-binding XRE family transcriptional regulator